MPSAIWCMSPVWWQKAVAFCAWEERDLNLHYQVWSVQLYNFSTASFHGSLPRLDQSKTLNVICKYARPSLPCTFSCSRCYQQKLWSEFLLLSPYLGS